jgi:hypothetical protein
MKKEREAQETFHAKPERELTYSTEAVLQKLSLSYDLFLLNH